jgi:hypothetical protein
VSVTDPEFRLRVVLNMQQRRDFVALICRVAWAHGVIGAAESARLARMRQHVADDAISAEELQAWLRVGPPEISARLPAQFKHAFQHASVTVVSDDGVCDAQEMRVIRELLVHAFEQSDSKDQD